jgi:hypothetical protein
MGQAQECRVRAPPHPPYGSRDGTPDTCRAQPDQIYRDRNSFPVKPAGYSLPGNSPFLLERRVPGRKFVIAVANGVRACCDQLGADDGSRSVVPASWKRLSESLAG